MPQLSGTIKSVYSIPKLNENGIMTLPRGHEFNDSMKRELCPVCGQPKYKIKRPFFSFSCSDFDNSCY